MSTAASRQHRDHPDVQHGSSDYSGIRPLENKDLKVVRQLVGQSVMEGLAESNKRTYFSIKIFVPYVVLSLLLDYAIGWWPTPDIWWSPISLVIGFGAVALPGLFIVELINRSYFESLLRTTLGSIDLVSPLHYYAAPSSGFFVLVHHGEIIGCVALDASNGAGTKLKSVIEPEDGKYMLIEWADIIWRRITGKKAEVKAERNTLESTSDTAITVKPSSSLRNRKQTVKCSSTASTVPSGACTVAHIRHLYVDQFYRRHHCATDLVNSALESAFVQASKDGTRLERAIIKLPGYSGEGAKVLLARMGFKDVQLADDWVREGRKVGGDGWLEVDERVVLGAATFKARWLELTRQEWEERMKVTGR